MERITLGIVKDAFSLDGTLKIISKTQFGKERYKTGNKIYLVTKDGDSEIVTVEKYRSAKDYDFVKFVEISSIEDALVKKNYLVQIDKINADLPKGFYHYCDLEGCKVYDCQTNTELGTVKLVEEFPAQITLRISTNKNKDFFVPFVSDFIYKVDIDNKSIFINVVEGML